MKIIIIGAGISGLATYLVLKKHLQSSPDIDRITIQIYEAYDIHKLNSTTQSSSISDNEPQLTPSAIGSAIGISQNGLNVLRRLDDGSVLDEVLRRGNPIDRWRMSNARGWTLADISTVSGPTNDSEDFRGSPMTVMIARQHLWEILRDRVLKFSDAVMHKKVREVQIGEEGSKSTVKFEDGSVDEADLIIGADGLRSVVRRAMFQSKKQNERSQATEGSGFWSRFWPFGTAASSEVDYITPQYEGLVGVGGFIPTAKLQQDKTFDPKTMNIVFGPNGFFGYGCISSAPPLQPPQNSDGTTMTGPISAWWSTFSSPIPYPYSSSSNQAHRSLLHRHESWNNPTIQRIISHTSKPHFSTSSSATSLTDLQTYPTWTTPLLPTYHVHTAILVGDAAHTLQPTSGQGASLALEDAETLALLLLHHLLLQSSHPSPAPSPDHPLTLALSHYDTLRLPRIRRIHAHSQNMSRRKLDMGFLAEMVMYLFIYLGTKFNDGTYDAEVLGYDLPAEVERVVGRDLRDRDG